MNSVRERSVRALERELLAYPGLQERRRCVTVCLIGSRQEDAVGYARVEMHVVVERRAKAVQEGDAAVPRAGRTRRVGGLGDACGVLRFGEVVGCELLNFFVRPLR